MVNVESGVGVDAGPQSTSVREAGHKANHQRIQPCEAVQNPIPSAAERLRSTKATALNDTTLSMNASLP